PEVDHRLVRRVEQGTVVPLGIPGLEARRRLLARQVEQSSVTLAPPVLDAVARLPLGSIREYLGAVNRLLSFQEVSTHPLNPEDALVLIGVAGPAENGRETAAPAG